MNPLLYAIARIVRRVPDVATETAFFRDVLGLPVITSSDTASTLWLGETSTLEIVDGGVQAAPITDRFQAPLAPILRTHDLTSWVNRLQGVAPIINDFETVDSRLIYFLTPSGQIFGLQERYPNTERPEDLAANERWAKGDTAVNGVAAMSPTIQHMGWVGRRIQDLETSVAFYCEVLGFDLINRYQSRGAMLTQGENVRLDLGKGGDPPTEPNPDTQAGILVYRVWDLPAYLDGVRGQGATVIERGETAYVADPDGHVLGFYQQPATPTGPVDREAARRRPASV
jgi:catechol 2,3-dioxygenase